MGRWQTTILIRPRSIWQHTGRKLFFWRKNAVFWGQKSYPKVFESLSVPEIMAGGGVLVLLPVGSTFVWLTGALIIFPRDAVPVLLLGFVAFPIVPGGTLIMLPGRSVPVLLFPGSAFVVFLIGLNMLAFPGEPVLLPDHWWDVRWICQVWWCGISSVDGNCCVC